MKTFAIQVTVYVQGGIAEDALGHLSGELDHLCGSDNQLLAVSYPDATDIQEETQ